MSAATLATVQAETSRVGRMEIPPAFFWKVSDLIIPKLAKAVKPGDVRYAGARKIDTSTGFVTRHVFITIDVVEQREGLFYFNGESKGHRPSERLEFIARKAVNR